MRPSCSRQVLERGAVVVAEVGAEPRGAGLREALAREERAHGPCGALEVDEWTKASRVKRGEATGGLGRVASEALDAAEQRGVDGGLERRRGRDGLDRREGDAEAGDRDSACRERGRERPHAIPRATACVGDVGSVLVSADTSAATAPEAPRVNGVVAGALTVALDHAAQAFMLVGSGPPSPTETASSGPTDPLQLRDTTPASRAQPRGN